MKYTILLLIMLNKILFFITILLAFPSYVLGKVPASYSHGEHIVLNPNYSFSSQIKEKNKVYEIHYKFDLRGETITLPEGSFLIVSDGSLGNGTIDFTKCNNNQIYYSWFSDFSTCNNSLLYMDNKELVIDKDIHITESFSFPPNAFKHQNITIRGAVDTREARPRIIADGVPCFKVYGHFFTFKNLSFAVRTGNKEIACIEIESPMEGLNDVDCVISDCYFAHTGGGVAIKCKGRGITVENCIFQTPSSTVKEPRLDIAAITLFPDEEPKYPVSEGSQWHDAESSGRSIIIRNNRLHLSNPGTLVGLYANPDCPKWAFHGVQIVGNLVDAEGSLCVITAKNYGTLITNNVNYGRNASSSMYISNACDMLITNNILGQLSIEQAQNKECYDIVLERSRLMSDRLHINGYSSEVQSVHISDNILGSYMGSVKCNECDAFRGVSISNNTLGYHSFEGQESEYGILSIIETPTVMGITINNNRCTHIYDGNLGYCMIASSSSEAVYSDIHITNNQGFKNYLLGENVTFNNIEIKKSLSNTGGTKERPTSKLEKSDKGFYYFDTDLNCPLFWTGDKWVNSKGKKK